MQAIAVWEQVQVPVVAPRGWTRTQLSAGLRALERIARQVVAAQAVLTEALGFDERDTSAFIASETGMAIRDAKNLMRLGLVVGSVRGAADAIADGSVTAAHVRALAPIVASGDAAGLLELAPSQTVEEFERTVRRLEIEHGGERVGERQHNARSVVFDRGDGGMFRASITLPPLAGSEFRLRLEQIADAHYRAEHPDRASVAGGHGAEPYDRRMADALLHLVRGSGPCREGAAAGAGKPAVVVTIDATTLSAEVIGEGPIPLSAAVEAAARGDVFAAVRDMTGITMNFGRSRRLASALQKLALLAQDRHCQYPGCDTRYGTLHAHHLLDYENGGLTDLVNFALLCSRHHRHVHVTGQQLRRRSDCSIGLVPAPEIYDTG